MSLWRVLGFLLFLILFVLFVAPFFFGIHNIGNISGTVLTALLSLICLKYDKFKYIISNTNNIFLTLSAVILSIGMVILIVINTFMIANLNDYPKDTSSTLIVLGCKVKGTKPSLMLKRRLDSAFEYLSENPEVKVIVSGGKGNDEDISEAECMKNYLVQKGIKENRIFMEDKSSSTYENLQFSEDIINSNNLCKDITIVTDGYHQLRAEMIAKNLGYSKVTNISAKTSLWLVPTYWVREWFGIAYQFIKN